MSDNNSKKCGHILSLTIPQRWRLYKDQSMVSWINILEKDHPLRYGIQWWCIRWFVIDEVCLAYIHPIGLFNSTYYFPGWATRKFNRKQCIPALDFIIPKCYKNDPSRFKSWIDYWLHLPTIVISFIPRSPHYLKALSEQDDRIWCWGKEGSLC